MARILIAGCGDVGSHAGQLLAASGHEVWGLRRRASELPPELLPVSADLGDPATLTELPGCDVLAYTAAADGRDEAAYRRAYVEGVENLLAALAARGHRPRRVFFTSSTGVYGQNDGGWVDESSPTEPRHFTGTLVLAGEHLFRRGPFRSTALRLAGIYGPGRLRLVRQVESGQATLSREPSYTNRIHRDDGAGFLAHLIERELAGQAVAEVYLGVDAEPAAKNDVLLWLAERLGAPRPAFGDGPARPNKRCRNARLEASGYALRYPSFREGYAAILAGR